MFDPVIRFPVFLLIILELLVLSLLNRRTGWAKKKSTARRVVIVCTSILLILWAGLAYDLQSYGHGWLGGGFGGDLLDGFDVFNTQHVVVPPRESRQIGPLSNWRTLDELQVDILSGSSYVMFYILDDNVPQVKYKIGNCSEGSLFFRLPYRYSCAFVVANWVVDLYNSDQNETILVTLHFNEISSDGLSAMYIVVSLHVWPPTIIPGFWLYGAYSLRRERLRKSASGVEVGELQQDAASPVAQDNPERDEDEGRQAARPADNRRLS